MAGGRPTIYTQAIADEICERLAGGETLRCICLGPDNFDPLVDEDRHSHLPCISTVVRWAINSDHEFCSQYNDARIAQQETYADRLAKIPEKHSDNVPMARLLSDNLKWCAARMSPRRFGDRVAAEISDPSGEAFGTGATSQLANLIASAMANKNNEAADDEPLA